MANNNKDVEIKVKVDTSDVAKSMKDIEKSSDKMAKNVVKDTDKMNKAQDQLERQLKDTGKVMQDMFKNINISGLTKAMNNVKKSVSNTVATVKRQLENALNIRANVEVNAKTTTDKTDGAKSSGVKSGLVDSAMTGGAMGASIAKEMALIGKTIKNTVKDSNSAFNSLSDNMKTKMVEATVIGKEALKQLEAEFNQLKFEGVTFDPKGALIGEIDNLTEDLKKYQGDLDAIQAEINDCYQEIEDGIEYSNGSPQEHIQDLKELQQKYEVLCDKISRYQDLLRLFNTISGMDGLIDDIQQLGDAFEQSKTKANLEPLIEKIKQFRGIIALAGGDVTVFDQAITEYGNSMNNVGKITEKTAQSALKATTAIKNVGKAYKEQNAAAELLEKNAKELADANLLAKPFVMAKQAIPGVVRMYNDVTDSLKRLSSSNQQAAKSTEKLAKSNSKLQSSFKSLITSIAPILSLAAVFTTLKNSVNNAMESIETNNMFDTVFGNSAGEMDRWVNDVNKTLGLGITETKAYTSTIMQMAQAMGLSSQNAMEMSKTMTTMAGDISSFYNVDLVQAQNDLRSALSGSNEVLTKYGIVLREDTINQYAYANGIAAIGSELTAAQRAMTLTMMIEEQLGVANGDLARSINSPANQVRILRSNLHDLSVALGNCFMPILTVVLPILNRFIAALTATINTVANFISKLFSLFGVSVGGSSGGSGGGGGFLNDIADSVDNIGSSLGDSLGDASGGAKKIADSLADGAKSAKEAQKYLLGIDQINNLTPKDGSGSGSGSGSGGSGSGGSGGLGGSGGSGTGGGLLDGLADSAEKTRDESESAFGEIEQWIKDLANAMKLIWNTLKDGWNSVGGYISQSIENLKQAFKNLGTAIKDFLVGAWNNGGEQLIYNFGRLAGAIVGCALDIAGQVIQAFANLFNYLNPETNSITRGFIEALNRMLVASQNFALSLGSWFSIFMSSGGQAFLNVLGDIVMLIGTTLANVLAISIQLVTNFFNSWAGHIVIQTVAIALNLVAGAVKAFMVVVEKLTPLWSALLLLFVAKATFTTSINLFGKLGTAVVDFGLKLATNIEDVVVWSAQIAKKVFDTAKDFGKGVKDIYGHLKDMLGHLKDNIKNVIDWNKSHIKNLGDVKKGWSNFKQGFKDIVRQIATSFKDNINNLKNWCSNWKTNLSALGTAISTKLKSIGQMFTSNLTAIKNWGKTVIITVKDAVVKAASSFATWVSSLTLANVWTGICTASTWLLNGALAVLTSPITLIVAGIAALIFAIKKVGDHFNWWSSIMDWIKEKCGWLYDGFMKLIDGVKGFFGWGGDNNIDDEAEVASEAISGIGDTIEETSDRFGTSCSAINESLASIGIDTNKLATQLDEAEAIFNEKFGMISGNAREYLQAIADGNEDVLSRMSGDSDTYLAEIKSAFEDMSVQEQAVFYATYGEINGVTDGWLDYTTGSYEDCLIKHTAMLEQINNNEKLTYDEKKARIDEETQNFVNAQDEKLKQLNLTIAEMESAEWQSEEDKYNALRGYYEQRDQLVKDMENYQLGSIDTVDEAVKQSADTQSQAYDGVSAAQQDALKEVDTSLEETKGNLSSFKEESDKVASEIPKAWSGIGKTISDEFTNAKNDTVKCFNDMNKSIQNLSKVLKANLSNAFKDMTNNAKTSTSKMSKDVQNAFKSMCDSIKRQLNDLSNSMKNSFQNIGNTINRAFSDISTKVVSVLNNMKTQAISCLKSLETAFSSSMDKIKNVAETKMKSACDGMVKKVNESKTSIVNSFNSISTGINSSLDNLNRQVGSRMDKVLSTIRYYCRYMENATNFTFKTPYMKMPHIQVYGNWDFEKKTVPSFRVQWWSSGAVFNKRTILGGMGVGDAQNGIGNNPEAVLPLDALWSELDKQFARQNKQLSKGSQQPIQVQVVLDGKVVAQSTIKEFKDQSRRGVLDTSWL